MTRPSKEMQAVEDARRLADELVELLTGHRPDVQGAALADALASWLFGHHDSPIVREMVLMAHVSGVREMLRALDDTEAKS